MDVAGTWLSLMPPLLAIGLALALRHVILALAAGVWLGASLVAGDPGRGLLALVDRYAVNAVADSDHASVIVFTLLLGGMVGVISRSGGAQGLATWFTRFATTRSRGQLAGWGMGLVIFFDDYANSLLVGTSMRPITDRLRVSREKLAFLVDATAAPVASVALISSWIGVEIGSIAEQFKLHHLAGDPYSVFVHTIPYRFYPICMLVFGLTLVVTRRDFGPMRRAELRAINEGKLLADGARPAADFEDKSLAPEPGKPQRWFNALIPICAVVAGVLVAMWWTGYAKLSGQAPGVDIGAWDAFTAGDSYRALLWASLAGCLLAIGLVAGQRILTIAQAMDAWLTGLRSMILAVVILVLAWSLGAVCKDLDSAGFVVAAIGDWLPPGLLPAGVFVIAAAVSFATGTSWGTMGILFPLVIPLSVQLAPGDELSLYGTISSVLSGAVWGDHCSPISDTTILSSLAASCDHVDHVRTQLPYAVCVGLVCLVFGDLATGLEIYPGWVGLCLCAAALVGLVFLIGRPLDAGAAGRANGAINTRG